MRSVRAVQETHPQAGAVNIPGAEVKPAGLDIVGTRVRPVGGVVGPVTAEAHQCRNRKSEDAEERDREECRADLFQCRTSIS